MAFTISKTIEISIFFVNILFLTVLGAPQASGLTQALCSSDNTGSSFAVGKTLATLPRKEFDADLTNLQ